MAGCRASTCAPVTGTTYPVAPWDAEAIARADTVVNEWFSHWTFTLEGAKRRGASNCMKGTIRKRGIAEIYYSCCEVCWKCKQLCRLQGEPTRLAWRETLRSHSFRAFRSCHPVPMTVSFKCGGEVIMQGPKGIMTEPLSSVGEKGYGLHMEITYIRIH